MEKDLPKKTIETRKLVKWGSSETLIMSLPRNWVKKCNLTKESEVSIVENADGSLLVSPLEMGDDLKPKFHGNILFDKDMAEDYDLVELEITTKYLDGKDTIEIEMKPGKSAQEKFPPDFINKVQEVVKSLIGLEITSMLSTRIKIVDIMSIQESNINMLTKIIADTTIDFFTSLIEVIDRGDVDDIGGLLVSKDQVRKYYLRILRELRKGLLVPASLSKMGLTAQDTVDLAFFITYINETSENLEFMINSLKNQDVSHDETQEIIEFMNEVKEIFKQAVDAYLFKKKKDAVRAIKEVPLKEQKKRDLENKIDDNQSSQDLVHYQIVLDLNSKILDCCRSIAFTALRRIL